MKYICNASFVVDECDGDGFTTGEMIVENKASNSTDAVNHPSHYSNGKYECIEVMQSIFGAEKVKAFCELNAFKYMWRSNKKNGTEDLKKARFYTDYLIKMEGTGNEY